MPEETPEDEATEPVTPPSYRFAHNGAKSYLVLAGASAIAAVVTDPLIGFVLPLGCLIANMLLWRFSNRHMRGLCTICASMTPLDGANAAEDAEGDLRRFHHPVRHLLPWFFPIFVSALLTLLWGLGFIGELPYLLRPPTLLPLTYIAQALWAKAANRHMVLAPWCPYCQGNWSRGGSQEPSPSPDPSMPDTQQ